MAHFFSTGKKLAHTDRSIKPKMRLFCFPYAGGGASIYQKWTSFMPAEIELCAVQLPGRENRLREKPCDQVKQLVEMLGQELHPYIDLPFAFFGHSMGAIIGFELLRYLRRNGESTPNHFFVSGCRAPHLPAETAPIHNLPDSALLGELRRLKGTPEEILSNTELMGMLLPLLRADFALFENYKYEREDVLTCPITAFAGQGDSRAYPQVMADWRKHTCEAFTLYTLPGDHFFLHQAQDELVARIVTILTNMQKDFSVERSA